MNKYSTLALCLSSTLICSGFTLATQGEQKKELLSDIKAETKKCAVQLVTNDGIKKVVGFSSDCQTLKIISDTQAQIFIEGEWFQAKIVESSQSDGGDLDDLYITDAGGKVVAQRMNVAAYDSVIVAMAHSSDLREEPRR
jgi:hypothetical protein